MLNTLLIAFAVALILRALRIRVHFARIPFPADAPRGLAGVHLMLMRVPPGVGVMTRDSVSQVRDESDRKTH